MASTTDRRILDLQEQMSISTGTYVSVDSQDLGTRKYDLGKLVQGIAGAFPIWDSASGTYTNESLSAWLLARRDGKAYGVSVPKTETVACTKVGANAGIANPVPGWVDHPAIDPYVGVGPFLYIIVNGYVDADGTPHVTGIQGDGRFRKDGTNGDVWVLTPVLWWRMDESGADAVVISISDTQLSGMSAQPQAYLPNGTLRPYMLYAKYAGTQGADGYMHSYSGAKCWNRSVSHNSYITQCRTASTGYSGKSIADDWYLKVMFLLKYASKNSQSVFAGCTNYNLNYAVTVAETGVTRVIISKTNAANLVVGSSVTLGSSDHSNSVVGETQILSIADYDTDNSAISLDTTTTFNTTTSLKLSTAPWHSGSCDAVEGDGAPTQAGLTNGKYPFVLQGIETMVGAYEIIGDVIISNDGETGWVPFICYDSRNEATSVTANYISSGKSLPMNTTDGWKYPLCPSNGGGLLFGTTTGGSQSVGLCDGTYTLKLETTGTREWRGLGYLCGAGNAGLWCVYAGNGLTNAHWSIGGRLSATGRGRA